MTIASTLSRWEYDGDGSTVTFPYTNKIFVDADLNVYVDAVLQTLTTDYTVTGAGDDNGNVVFVTAPADGTDIIIVRSLTDDQQTDLPVGGAFPAESVEDMSDRRTIISQQQQEEIDRCLKIPVSDTSSAQSYDGGGKEIENIAQGDATTSAANVGQVNTLIAAATLGTQSEAVAYTVDTLTELQGVATSGFSGGEVRYMKGRASAGDGGEGEFIWVTGDKSTEVSADEVTGSGGDGGVWIAPTSDLTGASGAWERVEVTIRKPEWYGAFGSGDDSTELNKIISATSALGGGVIGVSALHTLASSLNPASNVEIVSLAGWNAGFTSTTLGTLFTTSSDISNFAIKGLKFTSSLVTSVTAIGCINFDGGDYSNIEISDNYFDLPTSGNNALVVKAAADKTVDGVHVLRNEVEKTNRIAFEFVNHDQTPQTLLKTSDLQIIGNKVKDASGGSFHMGISMSGPMSGVCAYNELENCSGNGIEGVSVDAMTIHSNLFKGTFNRLISLSGTAGTFGYTDNVSVTDNKTIGQATTATVGVFCDNSRRLIMANNHFDMTGRVEISGAESERVQVHDNVVVTTAANAIVIDGAPQARVYENEFDNSASGANTSTLRFINAGAANGEAFLNTIRKGTGGANYDNSTGADNDFYLNIIGDDQETNLPVGNIFQSSISKDSDGASETSLVIDFDSAASWNPANVKVMISCCSDGGGGNGQAELHYHVRHVNSTTAVIMATGTVTAASGVTVTPTMGTGTMTLDVTTPSSGNTVNFFVEVSGNRSAVTIT